MLERPGECKKHPIHPMLVAVPIGLWIFALLCDAARAWGGEPVWSMIRTYCVAAGIDLGEL